MSRTSVVRDVAAAMGTVSGVSHVARGRVGTRTCVSLVVVLLCAVAATTVSAHECAHEQVERGPRVTTTQEYAQHAHEASASVEERRRRLAETVWEPIRIKVEYSNFAASLTAQQVSFVQNTLVPAAVQYWERALTVDRVDGNLFAERHCVQRWNTNGKCKTYADVTRCGSHSNTGEVAIPDSMFKSQEVCSTDPLVCSNTAGGAGVSNADFVLFVTANSDSSTLCPGADGDTLAFASACQFDQHDRPSFARANFCPYHISTDPNAWEHQLSTAVHELAHALGFSSDSMPFFRDEVGDPRTPREADGTIASANVRTFTCDGASRTANMPSTDTVQYFAERGHDSCDWKDPSSCVMKLVTPKVVALSRVFFGCNSLQGAELENQPTAECTILGSHWEARLFMDETMAAFASHNPFTSPVTLALFEDSGWYRANYSMATPLQPGVHWGFQQGCEFALDKCVAPKAAPVSTGTPAHFCADISTPAPPNTPSTCTMDRRAKARCSQATWANLPAWYQYFENDALAGGFQTADFCPYPKPFTDLHCRNPSHAPANNYQGETFNADSLCLKSTLNQAIDGFEHANPQTGCYQVECVSPSLLRVTVRVDGGTAQTVDCTDGSTQHSVPGFSGVITCINPARFCASPQLVTSDTANVPGVVWLSRAAVKVTNQRQDFVTLSVVRVLGSRGGAHVTLQTRNGTAVSGRHFRATNTTVSWADGEAGPKLVSVPLLPATHRGEVFYVDLTASVNVTLSLPSTTKVVLGSFMEKKVDTNAAVTGRVRAALHVVGALALAALATRRL